MDVHPVALLEVGLGLAGHNGGEVEHHIGPKPDERPRHVRVHQIRHDHLRPRRGRSIDDVDERQRRDALAGKHSFTSQVVGQLPAEHPRRAENHDAHGVTVLQLCRGFSSTGPRRTRLGRQVPYRARSAHATVAANYRDRSLRPSTVHTREVWFDPSPVPPQSHARLGHSIPCTTDLKRFQGPS